VRQDPVSLLYYHSKKKVCSQGTAELYEIYESESSYAALIWGDCMTFSSDFAIG
jgi:hypothetical protein